MRSEISGLAWMESNEAAEAPARREMRWSGNSSLMPHPAFLNSRSVKNRQTRVVIYGRVTNIGGELLPAPFQGGHISSI
jgi:hypothetical protein